MTVTNVLIDEANRKHAENAARAAAVAGARSFEEARALGAAHAQKETAERTNAAAYVQGIGSAGKPRVMGFTPEQIEARIAARTAARASRRIAAKAPAAPTVQAPNASTPKSQPAAKAAPAPQARHASESAQRCADFTGAAPVADTAYKVRLYMNEQAKAGRYVSVSAAFAHIINSTI